MGYTYRDRRRQLETGESGAFKKKTHECGTNFLYRVQSSPYLRAHLASSRELRCSSIVAWKTG